MPLEDSLNLPSPLERDFVSTIPATDREFLRRLAPMLRPAFTSEQERDTAYGTLGLSDSACCVVPSEGAEYKWDGRQWLAYDLRRRTFNPNWKYGTTDAKSISVGNGTCTGTYLREGPKFTWEIVVVRGSTTWVGDGSYSWELPIPAKNFRMTGTGYVRNDGLEIECSVVGRSSTSVALVTGGKRIGHDSVASWAVGAEIVLYGEAFIGGIL